jgi:hypothetical protein
MESLALYNMPINFKALRQNHAIKSFTVQDSIKAYIHTLLSCRIGDFAFDPQFGCTFWSNDFDVSLVDADWINAFEKYLVDLIKRYELRLHPDLEVKVTIDYGHNGEFLVLLKLKRLIINETNENMEDIDYKVKMNPFEILS